MVSTTFTADSARPQEEEALGPSPWIIGPVVDSLFVMGGMLWIIFALQVFCFHWDNPDPAAPGMAGRVAYMLLLTSTLGSYLFADSHTVATYMRVFATKESREHFKLYAYYLPWCSVLLFALCLIYPKAAGFCVYLHMMWVFQHYVGQTFGISLIYCYKRNYFFQPVEREIYRWFMHSFSFFIISRILCFREFSPDIYYGVRLPFYGLPSWVADCGKFSFIVMTLAFVTVVVRKYIRDKQLIPLPTLGMIFSILGIGFATGMANSIVWVFGPPFFHGTQYLAVSLGFYLKEKGLAEGRMYEVGHHMLREFFKPAGLHYWGMVILAGIFIYVGIPSFFEGYGYTFGMIATTIQACINFHHFVTDGAIWRLRDRKCREILLA